MLFKKTCKFCGQVFYTKRYPSQFCSQSCYFKQKRADANKKRLEVIDQYDPSLGAFLRDGFIYFRKKCEYCGKEFDAKRTTVKYCCGECHRKAANRRDKERKEEQRRFMEITRYGPKYQNLNNTALRFKKYCLYCGMEFIAQKRSTKFCSNSCARKYRLEVQRGTRSVQDAPSSAVPLPSRPENKEVMRIPDAAAYLSVSRSTVCRLLNEGKIQYSKAFSATLIRKESLDSFMQANVVSQERLEAMRKKRQTAGLPQFTQNPAVELSSDYISIADASRLYDIPIDRCRNILRCSKLKFERFRNVRFYLRKEVDPLLKKRLRDLHPEITEWYTVQQVMELYGMSKSAVYQMGWSHDIVRKRVDKIIYYSKKHIDEFIASRRPQEGDYYTSAEACELMDCNLHRLYRILKAASIPKKTISGKVYISKEEFDDLVRINRPSKLKLV